MDAHASPAAAFQLTPSPPSPGSRCYAGGIWEQDRAVKAEVLLGLLNFCDRHGRQGPIYTGEKLEWSTFFLGRGLEPPWKPPLAQNSPGSRALGSFSILPRP